MKNVVIIIVDALRPKNLSLFGYKKENDTNLKILSKESLLFIQHFSSSNSTFPSLTSLFTGKYPNNHGIIHQFPYTQQSEIEKFKKNKFWLPSYLQNRGYNTIAIDWIGMWLKNGFNYYEEKEDQPKKFLNYPFVKKILLNLPSCLYKLGKKVVKVRTSTPFSSAEKSTDLAISKIKTTKMPFFLFIHFWDTHFPFPTIKKPKDIGIISRKNILGKIENNSQRDYVRKRFDDISLNYLEPIEEKYDLAIKKVDEQIGRLISFLKRQNLWEDIIFIVLGDHGESLKENGIYFSHSGLYEESIHVPLIMKFPGQKSRKIKEFAQNTDVVPTLLDYFKDKTIKEKFDGASLLQKSKRKKIFAIDGLAEDVQLMMTKNKKIITAKSPKCHLCKSIHHTENL